MRNYLQFQFSFRPLRLSYIVIPFLKLLTFQYNLIVNMLNRQVGTLTSNSRTVGKFYQTQKVGCEGEARRGEREGQPIRSRTKSVGRIYNTNFSKGKEVNTQEQGKMGYDRLINYKEMENKLSSYLESTIRTSTRQKYNYLSTQFTHKYETLAKEYPITYEPVLLRDRKTSLTNQIHQTGQYRNLQKERNEPLKERTNEVNRFGHQIRQKIYQSQIQKPILLQTDKNNQNFKERSDKKSLKNSRKRSSSKENHHSAGKQSNKENYSVPASAKKENALGLISLNHQEHKNELQNKLKKMINNYEIKNKQLEMELKKIEIKQTSAEPKQSHVQPEPSKQLPAFKEEQLKDAFTKLVEYNLKGINLSKECDEKLQQIWKSIHQQILVDQQLRMIKCFISQANINTIFNIINQNRIKKIEITALKTNTQEYDPFLIEKFNEFLKTNNPNLTHKTICKWIGEQFVKCYEAVQKNWLKHLSQERIQCFIRTMALEKQVTGLRKTDGSNKQLLLRDFTRYMSTLYKANLRNRNVFQIHTKLKGMSYLGRFIEMLQQKAGNGVPCKKAPIK